MPRTNFQELLDAGVHFGHLKRKWNPNMAPYIFMEKNGIHIIDLQKTVVKIDESAAALKQIAKSGRKILFVATKKQAKDIVSEAVGNVNMPYVVERWPGGMLTNVPTIRKSGKNMNAIVNMKIHNGLWGSLSNR
ncbi:MAG: 30S ribosomal protein S2, partial [Mangrovibacterium sp.]